MNKRLLLGITIVVVGLVLGTTAFALSSGNNGYEVYKTALKNTWVAQSLTATVGVSVTDDGYPRLNSRDMVKMDLGSKNRSGYFIVSAGGQDCVLELYQKDGQVTTRMGGSEVTSRAGAGKYQSDYRFIKANAPELERIIDLLTLKLHDDVIISNNPDGTRDVSLQVAGDQVTEVGNLIASLLIKSADGIPHSGPAAGLIYNSLPKLTDNIKVNGIDLQAKVNADDLIAQQTLNIAVSGNDASGNPHNLMVGIDLNLSNFNNTIPEVAEQPAKN